MHLFEYNLPINIRHDETLARYKVLRVCYFRAFLVYHAVIKSSHKEVYLNCLFRLVEDLHNFIQRVWCCT